MSVAIRQEKNTMATMNDVAPALRSLQVNPNAKTEGAGDTPPNMKPSKTDPNPFGGSKNK